MSNFIKSNSCLLAIDSSPAFSTGERLGLYFVDFLQNFEFSISPPRTQTRQIGSQDFGVDSVNFSPDVLANISFNTRRDLGIETLLGSFFRPSGVYFPVFSGLRDFSFNAYLFTSDLQGYDLIKQIQDSQSFSGLNVISLGNCYLNNLGLSFAVNSIPRSSCSFIASNIVSETLTGNYMQIPAINLESGTTGDAATIFLNPNQVDRLPTGYTTGEIINSWSARFQPTFENLQIPHNQLSNFAEAAISSIDITMSIDRENSYGFGSDYVFERDVKYPIQGSISIGGLISDYQTGSFADLMTNEKKYDIQIYDRDYQDEYLSGLSLAEFTGINETGHIVDNHWLRFENCVLREKRDSVSVNGLFGFSTQFDFTANEFGGFSFKNGDEKSLDSVSPVSSDWHELISSDEESVFGDFFLRYYEDDCSIATLLSSDKLILLTTDNFCYDSEVQECVLSPSFVWQSIGYFETGINFAGSISGGFSNSNSSSAFVSYPMVAKISGLNNGNSIEYGAFYTGNFIFSGVQLPTITGSSWYRIDRDIFQYSGNQIINYTQNWFPERASFSAPQIQNLRWTKYSIPTVVDNLTMNISSGNAEAVEILFRTGSNGWLSFNNASTQQANFFSAMMRLVPPTGGGNLTGIIHRRAPSAPFGTTPFLTNFFEYYPIGYRGTGILSGSLTGAVRDCASGLSFDEGSITFNETATLRWNCFNSGAGIPTGWNIYRFMSGVGVPSKIGSSSSRSYTDGTMTDPGIYGFYVSSLISGYESNTGTSSIAYIEAF